MFRDKNFACAVITLLLMGMAPVFDLAFGLDLPTIAALYFGFAAGVPYGAFAHKTDLDNKRQRGV